MMRRPLMRRPLWTGMLFVFAMVFGTVALAESSNPSSQAALSLSDLYKKNINFYIYQQDYFSAISKLLAARHQGKVDYTQRDFDLLLAYLKVYYGLLEGVSGILQNTQNTYLEFIDKNASWYRLANIYFRNNDFKQAEKALSFITGSLSSPEMESERKILEIQLLVRQKRMVEALTQAKKYGSQRGAEPYLKLNMAVFLWQQHQQSMAAKLLKEVAATPGGGGNHTLQVFKDIANLYLSRLFLARQNYAESARYSVKIWADSMFYNQAQLVLGETQYIEEKYSNAITEWQRMNAWSADISSQEVLLLLADAHRALHDEVAEEKTYIRAVQQMENLKKQLTSLREQIKSGSVPETLLEDENMLSNNPLLWAASNNPGIYDAMDAVQDALFLENNVKGWSKKLELFEENVRTTMGAQKKARFLSRIVNEKRRIKALKKRIQDEITYWRGEIRTFVLAALDERERHIDGYLGEAYFGLATLHDQIKQTGGVTP